MKRIALLSGVLLCGILTAQPAVQGNAPLVAVSKVSYQIEEDVRRYMGRIESPSTVKVLPRVSGEILEVGFQDGQMVKKGQMLYKLDPVQYYAVLKACEAKVAQGKAKIAKSEALELYAKNNYLRVRSLFEKNVNSKDEMESAKSGWDVARANLEESKSALLEDEANLISARDNFEDTTIIAPMDCLAGVTEKTVGNYVMPANGPLVTLIQVSPMRVRFSISYQEFLLFRQRRNAGNIPTIRIRMSDGQFYPHEGKLELINNTANQNTDSLQLYASFDNEEQILYHGGTVSVFLNYQGEKKLAVLPSCIMHDAVGAYVYVLNKENQVNRRDVKLDLATSQWQFIADGLVEGETVIHDGMQKTHVGGVVRTAEEAAPARQ